MLRRIIITRNARGLYCTTYFSISACKAHHTERFTPESETSRVARTWRRYFNDVRRFVSFRSDTADRARVPNNKRLPSPFRIPIRRTRPILTRRSWTDATCFSFRIRRPTAPISRTRKRLFNFSLMGTLISERRQRPNVV